jgi:hypothetical protein
LEEKRWYTIGEVFTCHYDTSSVITRELLQMLCDHTPDEKQRDRLLQLTGNAGAASGTYHRLADRTQYPSGDVHSIC